MHQLLNSLKRFRRSAKKSAGQPRKCRLEIETLEERSLLSGNGLLGQYYAGETLTDLITSRVDPTVNFVWTGNGPVAGIAATDFSVRWTGQLQANFTGETMIYTKSDDGVRVYLNGKLIINDWTLHSLKEDNAQPVNLIAGQKYTIEVDYFQNIGAAAMHLYWANASTPWEIIPTSQLYPPSSSTAASPPKLGAAPTTVSNWFTQNLHDPGIISTLTTVDTNNTLTRNDMLAVFQEVESKGALTSTELTDLQTLVNDASALNMPVYVENLTDKVVYGDPANADYLGKPLGNLAVGSSATQLTDLVGKWFLGTDLPVVTTSAVTYQYAAGTLFGPNGPQYTNVVQGEVDDCYFVGGVSAVAFNSPQAISADFIDNGDGTFTVRFFNNGTPDYVTVNRYLPTTSNGQLWYAGMGWSINNASNVLWVPLLEKAYAQLAEEGWSRPTAKNAYASLDDGWEGDVMTQLTGKNMSFAILTPSATVLNVIVSEFQNGKMVCLDSDVTTSSSVVPNHTYAMLGFNASSQTFTLYNPWGSTVQLTWSQITANFDAFTYSA